MEKSARETQGSELDSACVQVAEEEPPKQPDNDNQTHTQTDGEKEGSGSVSHESEHNLQPKVEQGDVQAENASESSKRVQKPVEEIPAPIGDQKTAPEAGKSSEAGHSLGEDVQPQQKLQVQQVGQVVELVLEEAAICEVKQEPMEEATDIEEPQKYAFREKTSD